MNFFYERKFTEAVFDLFVVQKINFSDALGILKGSVDKKIRLTAEYLCLELEKGSLLSEAMLGCEIIRFDAIYVMFVKFAERTGDLAGVFSFLKNRCDRKKQNVQRMIEAAVYPIFVIILALVFCVLFFIYGKSLFGSFLTHDSKAVVRFCKDLFLLFVFCAVLFCSFWKNMKENKLYEAFLGMGFLIKAGVNVSLAVGYGMLLVGPDSRYGKMFQEAQKRLEYGMDLRASFGFSDDGEGRFSLRRDRNISDALYFAQQTGEKSDVFKKIANNINTSDEKKRKLCLCLIEPVLIAVTGMFLLILIVNFLLPLFTNISLI